MGTLQYSSEYGDYRNGQIAVSADASRQAFDDWMAATYGERACYTDEQYQAGWEEVDDPRHWLDLVDVEGSGVYSLDSLD